MLASRVEPFLLTMMTYGLANTQIRMPFRLAFFIMNVGLPESAVNLNFPREPLDRDANIT
jgi:hypothetical protein